MSEDKFPTFLKFHFTTLIRDSMFYGYNVAKMQEGKVNIEHNVNDFLSECCPAQDYDPESIRQAYYRFIEKYKNYNENAKGKDFADKTKP